MHADKCAEKNMADNRPDTKVERRKTLEKCSCSAGEIYSRIREKLDSSYAYIITWVI